MLCSVRMCSTNCRYKDYKCRKSTLKVFRWRLWELALSHPTSLNDCLRQFADIQLTAYEGSS